jgi:hypothetical protein
MHIFFTFLFSSDVSGRTVSLTELMADDSDDEKQSQPPPKKPTTYVSTVYPVNKLSNAPFSSSKRKVSQVIE